jgi:hypothetical protein
MLTMRCASACAHHGYARRPRLARTPQRRPTFSELSRSVRNRRAAAAPQRGIFQDGVQLVIHRNVCGVPREPMPSMRTYTLTPRAAAAHRPAAQPLANIVHIQNVTAKAWTNCPQPISTRALGRTNRASGERTTGRSNIGTYL